MAKSSNPFFDSYNSAFKDMQAKMQSQYAKQSIQQQLNQQRGIGLGMSQSSGLAQLLGGMQAQAAQPAKPKKPMEDAKFQEGDKVTVRTGKKIWTILAVEPFGANWMDQYSYILADDTDYRTREPERDLKGKVDTKTKVDFNSVIMADEKRAQILEALEQIHQSDLIFETWGFGETIEKGRGVSMLFYGPPGTGKTMVAQAIANMLEFTLKVISTADIESSAPGEAERNIRKHFKDAKNGKTILLFDECDSLIFTRQNVGPIMSAQINELLSQIERFDGITLFTTNRLGTLDEAVNRRLALKLEFDMPTPEQRAEIWKRMFPKQCPLDDDIDWNRLAGIDITGGFIKNAVLRAVRMAAIEKIPDAEKRIKMNHLVTALKLETESMIDFQDASDEFHKGIGRGAPQGQTMTRGRGREIVNG